MKLVGIALLWSLLSSFSYGFVLGTDEDLDTWQPIQLGMSDIWPDPDNQFQYTKKMMPYVVEASELITYKPSLDCFIKAINLLRDGSKKANTDERFGSAGYFRSSTNVAGQTWVTANSRYRPWLKHLNLYRKHAKPIGQRTFTALDELIGKGESRVDINNVSLFSNYYPLDGSPKGRVRGTTLVFFGKPNKATEKSPVFLVHSDSVFMKQDGYETENSGRVKMLFHIRRQQVKNLRKAFRASTLETKVAPLAANLYYDLQHMYYIRGTSGVGVATFLASLKALGGDYTAFKKSPELVAYTQPVNKFIEWIVSGEAFE